MIASRFSALLSEIELIHRTGAIRSVAATFLEADGPSVPLGSLCAIDADEGRRTILAEVSGLREDSIVLAPLDPASSVRVGAKVVAISTARRVPVGNGFAGRAVNAMGLPLDDADPIIPDAYATLDGERTSPLDRAQPNEILQTGLRAIDGLLTIGIGQRVGIFAAAGVGKTTLQSHLSKHVKADRYVICLVGERGREIEAAWSNILKTAAASSTTLVAAASDQTAAMRVRAVEFALTLAEYWRKQDLHVLFLLDSATRLSMALREIGLAAGEPATMRAYTPSVFAALPRIVERCGALKSGGAITAFMTVLAETDDVEDPISEVMKSLLDGHIILSRTVAEQGIYPAIDANRSLSRFATKLWSEADRIEAEQARLLLSAYDTSRTLIEAGVYVRGSNATTDQAVDRRPALLEFLKQASDQASGLDETRRKLRLAIHGGNP